MATCEVCGNDYDKAMKITVRRRPGSRLVRRYGRSTGLPSGLWDGLVRARGSG